MAVGGCALSSDNVVVKSPTDRRLYRYIQLANGLCALLVHDPDIYSNEPSSSSKMECSEDEDEDEDGEDDEEDEDSEDDESIEEDEEEDEVKGLKDSVQKKAAAAMCVGTGSFADPYEAQGLAHFLEHMLFMGSTEFPDENEYDSYLSKHGGSSNAYTETEYTCYHFEVKREFLKGALMRFAQFFVSPLVKAEAMEREVLAVDSEFNQALQSDSCRLQQLQCHTSAHGHPFNRFFWGNKKSLADAMEKGVNLRDRILKLYHDNYYGESMKLVVIGGETLEVLESWVLELFSSVKKAHLVKPETSPDIPIWKAGKLYWLEAVKDVHILDLSWTLPSLRKDYKKKAEDYLAHLLGHEGRGSLHFFLKAKGWATSISAGVSDEGMYRSSIAYIFGMSIYLTDSGLEKIFEIIGFVYQYLKLLREDSPKEWIFKELQDIGNMEFRFAEDQPQDDYAAELAGNLLVYPPEHVIYGDYAYEVWDKNMIKHLLGLFRPGNMRVDILTKSFEKSNDIQHEPWFASKYVEEDIPLHLMDQWEDPPQIDSLLHLPSKNDFIPRDFSLRSDRASCQAEDASSPRCILDGPGIKLWYKLDKTFNLPRANTYFRINLKGGYSNIRNALLTELFVLLLKDELNEIIYQASVAKLESSVSLYGDKLQLKLYGFNDKLSVLLSKILAVAKSFLPKEDRFRVVKEDLERTLRNTNMKPLSHSSYLRLQILCRSFWDVEEKLCLLNGVSLSDLKAFIPDLLSQLYVEGLCHGNLLEEEAIQISDIFKSNFSVLPLPLELRHMELVMCLPPSADLVRDIRVKNKLETNSVVELYFQIEPEEGTKLIQLKALIDLFDEIVAEPLFNQLRTKEQLGYVVDCGPRVTYRIIGFCFRVQSCEYNPGYLQGRIESFINGLEEMLNELDHESFDNYKNGLTGKLLEKDPSLLYETNRFWDQITDKRYMFDLSAKEAEELKNIQKGDIINWYHTYLRKPSPKCRRLAARVWGCNTDWKDADSKDASRQGISGAAFVDLLAFCVKRWNEVRRYIETLDRESRLKMSEGKQYQLGTIGALSLSVVSSVSIVICNKALISTLGFTFATTLTSWHLLVTFCFLHIALWMKCFPNFVDTFRKTFNPTINPINLKAEIICSSIQIFQMSITLVVVSFWQHLESMTKLAIIPCTVLLETLFFRKIFSRNVQASLGVLLLGVGIATVTDLQLNVLGSVLSLLAVVTTCIAQIMTNTIQKKFKVSSTQLLYQSCPYQAITLFLTGPFVDGMLTNLNVFAFNYTPKVLAFIVLSCLISVSVNFSTFLVIGKTSPVTYQVLGHLKTCLVLAFGYVLLRDPFSWRNILGILIAIVGMVLYSYYCTIESQQKTNAEAAQLSQAKENESDPLLSVENGGGSLSDSSVARAPGWNSNKDLQA
ncbi:Insulinase (Peptidase family M16) family protein [Striga hermonthica]|uniref:Insulinase (Peptidase family M16) family protein n=1 Tax=Striga hermonthica TaxID=68872 RepID=A0A9N7NS95_STRHE|nr:Insulinase (Peptidase family M16) family protein [Striga hermonthica]